MPRTKEIRQLHIITEERKIITKEHFISYCVGSEEAFERGWKRFWDELPDAPKHTDNYVSQLQEEIRRLYQVERELQARIKELEAKQ